MSDKPLTADQQRLVEEHVGTAMQAARKHRKRYPWGDAADVESDAYLALCLAAQEPCPIGVSFAHHATEFILRRLELAERRDRRRRERHVSVDDPEVLAAVEEQPVGHEGTLAAPVLAGELEAMRGAVGALTRHQTMVLAGASIGLSDAEMAERMGVGRHTVKTGRKRGILRLRNKLSGERTPNGSRDVEIAMRGIGHLEGTIGASPGSL
jgi:DNA-directed RNA polymerase specialized sigma24 family protein